MRVAGVGSQNRVGPGRSRAGCRTVTRRVEVAGGRTAGVIRNLAADVTGFTSNAFLVAGPPRASEHGGENHGRRVLVDAGSDFDVVDRVREAVGTLDAVVLTHTHPDHIGNVSQVRADLGVETWGFDPGHDAVDHAVADGEKLRLGTGTFEAVHTPGHADDHLCLYAESAGVLFAANLVFQNGGFGRTDLAGGDRETLISSISRIQELVAGELQELHAGHGPSVLADPWEDIELAARAARMGR